MIIWATPSRKSPEARQDKTHRVSSCSRRSLCTIMPLGTLCKREKKETDQKPEVLDTANLLLKPDSSEQKRMEQKTGSVGCRKASITDPAHPLHLR